jgi:hypothetical protein
MEDPGRQPQRARFGMRWKLVAALALLFVLIVGSILVWQWVSPPHIETAPIAAEPGAVSPEPPPVDSAQNRPAPPAAPPHILMVSATENTRLKVVTDQGIPAEYNLKAGEHLKLEARSTFNLLIGNAGGVKLNLNNKPVNVPGKRGEVVNLHLP